MIAPMACFLSHNLRIRIAKSTSTAATLFRRRSTISGKAQLIEIDLESCSSDGGDMEIVGLRKLEDLIHRIVVQRSAPSWLPFIPGSSYWVPPKRRPESIVQMLGKLANPLTQEETMSLTTVRGWPCSSFLIEGSSSETSAPKVNVDGESAKLEEVEVAVEVHIPTNSDKTSQSEDEEG